MILLDELKTGLPRIENPRPSDLGLLIAIGGPGASGLSTISHMISDFFVLEYHYAGGIMRNLGQENGFDDIEDFVNSDLFENSNGRFDIEVERRIINASQHKDVVVDSKLFSGIATVLDIPTTVRIWLDAPIDIRAKRTFEKRGYKFPANPSLEELEQLKFEATELESRFEADAIRYKNGYGIDYRDPTKYNDIVLNTHGLNGKQTFDTLIQMLKDGQYIDAGRFTKQG